MRIGALGKRLVLAFAGLLLAEIGARVFVIKDGCIGWRPLPPFGAVPHPRQRAWLDEHLEKIRGGAPDSELFDAELGWTWIRPGVAEAGLDRATRGPAHYAQPKPAGTLRIACFGDSFTFCADVDDADAWPRLVETSHPGWEVPNLGVPGYGTDQALLRFRRFAKDLGADVVCIGLMLENIGRNVNRYRPLWHPTDAGCLAKPRFALEHGELRLVPLPYASERALIEAISSGRVLDDLSARALEGRAAARTARPRRARAHRRGWLAYRARGAQALGLRGRRARARHARDRQAFHDEAIAAGARLAPVLILPDGRTSRSSPRSANATGAGSSTSSSARGSPSSTRLTRSRPRRFRCARRTARNAGGGGRFAPEGNRVVAGVVGAWIASHVEAR
jgi:hypothetical protein